MDIRFQTVRLAKRYPLQISRGTSTGSLNLFVFVSDGTHEGVGECAPGTGFDETLSEIAESQLSALWPDIAGRSVQEVYAAGRLAGVDPSALAGLDIALWDLLAKRAGLPLYQTLGLPRPSVATSVTIGINPIDVIRERVPEILARTGAKFLKVKLGGPGGIEADQERFLAAKESSAPFGVGLRVDANGGWDVNGGRTMLAWLADHGCDYVEQPLAKGEEDGLPALYQNRPLPIFADESCHFSSDILPLVDRVDGINLKLMKCGGITEALRIVATARAAGLQTMIGCMGESSVSIGAGASIGALFDHIDLDSHLNLMPDPAQGAPIVDGVIQPDERPGHGASLC